jgi:hypothetical protein
MLRHLLLRTHPLATLTADGAAGHSLCYCASNLCANCGYGNGGPHVLHLLRGYGTSIHTPPQRNERRLRPLRHPRGAGIRPHRSSSRAPAVRGHHDGPLLIAVNDRQGGMTVSRSMDVSSTSTKTLRTGTRSQSLPTDALVGSLDLRNSTISA